MRITHSRVIVTLLTGLAAGCTGTGSGLRGITGGNGGGGNGGSPVLAFFVQPNSANVGQAISPPVEVVVRDSLGSTDSWLTGTVSVVLASTSSGATLTGTSVVRPRNGMATLSSLCMDNGRPSTRTGS